MKLPTNIKTAATLTLRGTSGHFLVGDSARPRVAVDYLQTSVSLDLSVAENADLLDNLGPVREVFQAEHLGFDELLQREVDDSRVSAELIPYLLDTRGIAAVQFFPSIVAVLLPRDAGGLTPQRYYRPIEVGERFDADYQATFRSVRSGPVGSEHFVFEQPMVNHRRENFDANRLRINPRETTLAIIDGQHRAMALLALFRNLRPDSWNHQRREAYQRFYSQWSSEALDRYDLSTVSMPLTVLYFPQLHEQSELDFDLLRASRSVFLALNKNARPVTKARNRLLDDADIVAESLRLLLTHVKNNGDTTVPLWAVELDAKTDQTQISSPVAITSVNGLYYVIEHFLFGGQADLRGVRPRAGKFWKRTNMSTARTLLWLEGGDGAELRRRDDYTAAGARAACDRFDALYTPVFVDLLRDFAPYASWRKAFSQERRSLEEQGDRLAARMLFDESTMKESAEALVSAYRGTESLAAFEVLDKARRQSDAAVERAEGLAYARWLSSEALAPDERAALHNALTERSAAPLKTFRTTAFFAGLVCTLLELIVQRFELDSSFDEGLEFDVVSGIRDEVMAEFLTSSCRFFAPDSFDGWRRVLQLFGRDVHDDDLGVESFPIEFGFRDVLVRGEMKPDLWPVWRYVLLELFRTNHKALSVYVGGELSKARSHVGAQLLDVTAASIARTEGKRASHLSEEERAKAEELAKVRLAKFLALLGVDNAAEVASKVVASDEEA